jgi:uncharacterized protein
MIERKKEINTLLGLLQRHRIVGITGARQVGKTTLARMLMKMQQGKSSFFDLENPEDLARLADPMLALKELSGLVIIDEVQRAPNLFSVLRVLADRDDQPARFLVLGSASPELLKQGSESLAGRIYWHEISGLTIEDVESKNHRKLWLRGGLPRSYLARSAIESLEWRRSYIRTFLERDLPQLGINISSTTMRRFWTMLAHYHGQVWNASGFAGSFGVADTTVRAYLDRLTSALVVRQLQPWHENISKRQVKAPKIYISDSGLLHSLLNLSTGDEIESHPKAGASWEGFALEQIIRLLSAEREECYFWGTHSGAELDLLIVHGRKRIGFEIKRTSAPSITPSMRHAIKDLKLNRLDVIHAGENTFPLMKNVRAVAFSCILDDIEPLK